MSRLLWGTDTETTGADFRHGCKPFFVSSCCEDGRILYWEWDVNPLTRVPTVPKKDIREVQKHLTSQDHVWHNSKFDIRALQQLGIDGYDWSKAHDTHLASHVLASGESHKLKDLADNYLGITDDDQYELQEAVNLARRHGKKLGWRTASPYDPHFPATKSPKNVGWWVMDMWLPRAVAKHYGYEPEHPFWHVLAKYAITDAERTIGLWQVLREGLEDEGLEEQYDTRRKLLPVTFEMEDRGIDIHLPNLKSLQAEFTEEAAHSELMCNKLSGGVVTSTNSTQQLQKTLFGTFKFDPSEDTTLSKKLYLTKGGDFSTNKDVLTALVDTCQPTEKRYRFIKHLQKQRKYTKALEYMAGYERSGLKVRGPGGNYLKHWRHLYPNFNIAGTKTTRFASYEPNAQNISKQELINLRRLFGPLPGREWWGIDYQNIEMRIFAYCSGDKNLIEAFELGGSVHLIFAEVLFPKEFKACLKSGESFADKYKSTLYQWTKNGNFSLLYGAGKAKADSTYHVDGAYDTIRKKLPLIDRFMKAKQDEAINNGYITTLGGYRLQVNTGEPHKAVNYFVQGSAGWCMIKAMLRVYEYLKDLPDYHAVMTIHDELDFDFPKSNRNLEIIQDIADLMELSGDDIGMPTPVDVERHSINWSKKESLESLLAV
tara:strand:- start:11132 stop:13099 length:1968 start_codon:yes stop_codon:yes gene_type:complete